MRLSEIIPLLPAVIQRGVLPGSPLLALLRIMSDLQEPSEQVIGNIERMLSPRQTAERFVFFLARWVDLDRLIEMDKRGSLDQPPEYPPGLGHLRELIASAAYLSRWRGTRKGLTLFLDTATGISGFQIEEGPPDENGVPRPFHIKVRAPANAAVYRAMIERIVNSEKPAYVTTEPVVFE
jgi:phage tail-like protein